MQIEYIHQYQSPIGDITIDSDGNALNGLWFNGQMSFADTLDTNHIEKALPVLIKPTGGLISVSAVMNLTLRYRVIERQLRSVRLYGRSCSQSPLGRRWPMEKLQTGLQSSMA